MNKALQSYKEWLMFTRGKVEPKVGDKVKIGQLNFTINLVEGKCIYANSTFGINTTISTQEDWDSCYVDLTE